LERYLYSLSCVRGKKGVKGKVKENQETEMQKTSTIIKYKEKENTINRRSKKKRKETREREKNRAQRNKVRNKYKKELVTHNVQETP
jgi:hypothetical protein